MLLSVFYVERSYSVTDSIVPKYLCFDFLPGLMFFQLGVSQIFKKKRFLRKREVKITGYQNRNVIKRWF